jgi:hypothetical protein
MVTGGDGDLTPKRGVNGGCTAAGHAKTENCIPASCPVVITGESVQRGIGSRTASGLAFAPFAF